MSWTYNPADYSENDFAPIPEGDHRIRIEEVNEKTFRSGNEGYEITLSASGYNSRIWYYLVLNPDDPQKTNQRIGAFFDSFGITDPDMDHFRAWEGKIGAAHVKHEEYNGNTNAKIHYFIKKSKQDKLPPWKEISDEKEASAPVLNTSDDDLPW